MLTFVYLPYAHYQEKIKAKQVIREVSQWLNEARNMAINGFENETWGVNASIGLYFSNDSGEKWEMYFYAYPFTQDPTTAVPADEFRINQGRTFPKGTQFDWALSDALLETNLDNIFFFFEAITWEWSYYTINWWWSEAKTADIWTLNFSYKWSTSDVLKKSLKYDTRINTIDF